jgi:acetylornithine deacetylase
VWKEAKMSASARQKIVETIDAKRDKAIKFLQDMIKIPSVTGDEAKIQAFLSDLCVPKT